MDAGIGRSGNSWIFELGTWLFVNPERFELNMTAPFHSVLPKRRPAIVLTIALGLLGLARTATAAPDLAAESDVIIVGGTPAGIAAAVAAARLGSSVLLLEPTNHVGGIVTSGLTNADIGNRQAVAGLFYEFTRQVLDHYRTTYGPESPQVKLCSNGYHFEPHVAEAIFLKMLQAEGDKIRILYRHRLRRAIRDGDRVTAVVMENLEHGNRLVTFHGRTFIDATYEGDLAARAGVEYRVGRESRQEYGEPHAGRLYAIFGTPDLLPGSTGEADEGIQAFCFRIFVTKEPDNFVPIEKPEIYNPDDYNLLAEDIRAGRVRKVRDAVQLWAMPNNKWEVNSDHITSPDHGPTESLDLAEENWGYPEADDQQREKIFRRTWNYNHGLLWFLSHDPRVPPAIQEEMRAYGFARDEFADNGHKPWQMYVRQGRRILGQYLFTERDGELTDLGRTRLQPSSIAIAEYAFDSHGVHKYDGKHAGVREGYFYVRHKPIQIPYEVLLPRKVRRLLVPVCCSASHVGYQTIRMEPVFMALGQAAGVAAYLAVSQGVELDQLPRDRLQMALVERGAVVTHYDDLPFDHPAFAALQFLGARGLNPGYQATPDQKLTRQMGAVKLKRILDQLKIAWTPPEDSLDQPLRGSDVTAWLSQLAWTVPESVAGPLAEQELNVAQFAEVVYHAYQAGIP